MNVGDTVFVKLTPKGKKIAGWFRGVVQQLNGTVAKVQAWDGKEFQNVLSMVRDLKTEKPD